MALRKLAVRHVLDRCMDEEVAADLPVAAWTVRAWVSRYREGGRVALRDTPPAGAPADDPGSRPPRVRVRRARDARNAGGAARHDRGGDGGAVPRRQRQEDTAQVRVTAQEADPGSRQHGQPGWGVQVTGSRHSGAGGPEGEGYRVFVQDEAIFMGQRRDGRKALVPRGREDPRRVHGEPQKVRGVRVNLGRRVAVLPNVRRV